jgi:hypothetical protein
MKTVVPLIVIAFIVSASSCAAQSVSEPPRFDGTRAGASSQRAEDPLDLQNSITAAQGGLVRQMVGEAALEAAREEGTRFIDARRDGTHASGAEAGADASAN